MKGVILAGGTGNPFFTTDTCAALRASEIQADVLIKATKVDGVYSADPEKQSQATLFDKLSYDDVMDKNLKIMDHAAISLCKKNKIDIIVCNLFKRGTVAGVAQGEKIIQHHQLLRLFHSSQGKTNDIHISITKRRGILQSLFQ